MKRLALTAILTAFLAAGFAVAPAVPAQAAACAGTTGVTVIVDFSAFGGGVQTRCVFGDPATGLAALRDAGFTLAGTQSDGNAFVCRIDDKPGPSEEPCVDTPPGSRSWSYWHATRGGSWTYSTKGAAVRKPPQGTVEGWAFGDKARPSAAPPPPPAPPEPPPATTRKPAAATTSSSPELPAPAPSISDSPPPSASDAPASPSSSVAAALVPPLERRSYTGTVITIVIVIAIAALAIHLARRRRRLTDLP
ncbi:hypothetical protein [Catelliglobosispora koreensis]|uniref:hypothetical protein n=1 Tax=Catelliglobosispora koreensis TaxID=129052 RepID=UPI0003817E11|nr:hypothetical protein [Catelliglobosispora koreensis]